jgi:glycosyltransferase involved in cell wall biosynthesis
MPIRLLHVFPSFAIGGMQTQFATVAHGLGRRFHHGILALDGRTQCRAKLSAATSHEFPTPPPGSARGLAAAPAIARFLRAQAPAALITYNWGAIEWCLIGRLAGIAPCIHAEHGFGPDEAESLKPRRNLFRRVALAGGAPLVVPSPTLHDIARRNWGVREADLHLIPNGIDVAAMERRARTAPPAFVRDPGGLVVGAVAPLVAVKNHARLLRVFAAAAGGDARWRLVLVGDGPERAPLATFARDLGIASRTTFLGSLDDPAPAIAAMDVLAVTSLTEQMPYCVLEAMALARPIVSGAVGDIAAMVARPNRPFVVPRDDEAGLVRALRRIGADPALRQEIGRANRARCAAAYGEDRMCAAFAQLYRRAAEGRAGGRGDLGFGDPTG